MFVPLLSQQHTPHLYMCPLSIAFPAGNICASRRHLNSSRSITPRRNPTNPRHLVTSALLAFVLTTARIPVALLHNNFPPAAAAENEQLASRDSTRTAGEEKGNHQAETATKTRGPPTRSSPKGLASPITDDQDHVIRPRPLSIAERRLLRSRPRPRRA